MEFRFKFEEGEERTRVGMVSEQVHFSGFRIDLPNQQLWGGKEAVPLRPKTFMVLRHLVLNAGRLVTREELVTAVWPDTRGAEKGPKRCILELRAALGDRVHDPRFIETVGRLGYRFIAPLTRVNHSSPGSEVQFPPSLRPTGRPPPPGVVGRDPELLQLHRWLDTALSGARQVVFVTGEPGIGKTSVIETFLQQVGTRCEPPIEDGDVWIGRGQCIEHYGEGEAYLPVLEALGRLAAASEENVLRDLLRRSAPNWLAQLPALVTEAEIENLQRRLQGATRQRMLREIADVISALTAQAPLVLVLEDLHWSDYSTLDFFSSVTQCREPARLLLIGSYRSTEMANEHPLRSVAQELLSHGQARELPLAGITAAAVQRYLDTRFPRHTLSARFAHLLRRWTEGNPLFLVNLVDDLIEQEILSHAEGSWTLRASPDTIAARVPENSRRLIEKQMTRLAPAVQPFLEAASVAGMEFTAAAVASALNTSAERIEECCDQLARQELFLRRIGMDEWPDGTQTTRYGFRHAMYQQLWSERVPAPRQQRFHFRIGERQEQAYGRRVGEIAAELAVHFDKGREYQRAVEYRSRAAQNALQRSAHREAIDHLMRGLDLLAHLPDTPDRRQRELTLHIALGVPLTATKGYAAPEVERAYSRALELSEQVRGTAHIAQALLGLWVPYALRAELRTAHRLAKRSLRQTQRLHATDLALDAHNALGTILLWLGELVSAREHLEQGLALHNARQQRSSALHDLTDPGVSCLCNLAWALWHLGYPDQALQRSREGLRLAQELAQPYSVSYALNFGAVLHCFRREERQTQEWAEATMTLCREQGFPFYLATGTVLRGWSLVQQGHPEEGLPQMREGLAAFQVVGAQLSQTAFLALLAESYGKSGQAEDGLPVLADALAATGKSEERLYEAEIHRLNGELTLQLKAEDSERHTRHGSRTSDLDPQLLRTVGQEAEGSFLKAIEVARKRQAKSWELRATTSLSRLWRQQRRSADAYALLSGIYGWFSDGFSTVDLRAAKSLLRQLAQDVDPATR